MIVGDPNIFAIESEISCAYERLSLRAMGYFVIHVMGRFYGVKSKDATMLANSFDEIGRRITARGRHKAAFAEEPDAREIATTMRRALYIESEEGELFFGTSLPQFRDAVHSDHLLWAPDGDEAFDDGSYVMQFDVGDKVRLIAFTCSDDSLCDPESLRDAWLAADGFYGILQDWHERFETEWASLPKVPESTL